MSFSTYLGLWLTYLIAMLIALALFWNLTNWQRMRWLNRLLWLVFFVLAFTPAQVPQQPDFMAPAFIIGLFEYFQGDDGAVFNALLNLGVASLVALTGFLIYILVLTVRKLRAKKA